MRSDRASLALCAVFLALAASGCSGSSNDKTNALSTSTNQTSRTDTEATLIAAVRTAINEDHRMSVRVLWTNAVPARPRATAGPALVVLRRSAAVRARRGIRVRVLSEQFRVVSIKLNPSYDRAIAVVYDPQRVRPFGRDGRPLGRPILLKERARLELRRLGSSTRFVVWKVTPLK